MVDQTGIEPATDECHSCALPTALLAHFGVKLTLNGNAAFPGGSNLGYADRMTFRIAIVSSVLLTASLGVLDRTPRFAQSASSTTPPAKAIPVSAKVGPVNIESVEFTDRGRGASRAAWLGIVPGGSVSETSTIIRGHFVVENPSADEWEVTLTLEILDKSGKLIDKAVKKSTWEGEAKPFDFDHPILQYVAPSIAQVRIRLKDVSTRVGEVRGGATGPVRWDSNARSH